MNTNNVIEHQTALWSRLKQNAEQEQAHGAAARELWPQIAADMAALREKYSADQEFGAALVAHGIEYNAHDRAAFVWMGRLKSEALRDALANCESRSPKHFRMTVESWGDDYYAASVCPSGQTATDTSPETENTPIPTTEAPESEIGTGKTDEKQGTENNVRIDGRMPLCQKLGYDLAKKIVEQWPSPLTRQSFNVLVKATGGQKAIKRIAEMIDDYCVSPNSGTFQHTIKGEPAKSFSHRLFVDGLPHVWAREYGCTWTNTKEINVILDQIDDAIRMVEELGDGHPLETYRAWWKSRNATASEATTGPDISAFAVPVEHNYSVTPAADADQEAIVVHGQTIWPNTSGSYDFNEAWSAFHFWQDEDHALALGDKSAASRGRHFMSMTKWLEYVSPGFSKALHRIATAQHYHPDNAEDTRAPGKHFRSA
jgi:hypothetical protein